MNIYLRTHKRATSLLVAITFIALAWFVPQASRAQIEDVPAPIGTVNCFDYYSFGSVQINVTANVSSAVSGIPITFVGTISNDNPYPVVDGALYVKIFRLDDSSGKNVNGPNVVDQYFVRSGIELPANSNLPIMFSWDIPSYAMTGDYQLATFFTTSKKFNLSGLSFTDDVTGNIANFRVAGERTDGVWFDKSEVTVGDDQYYFAAFPPIADVSDPVTVTATIQNTTAEEARVPISWQLYNWDAGRLENLISQDTSTAVIPAGGSAPVSYVVQDADYPIYLLVGTVQWGNTESIINVRFVREEIDRTRINFPSITAFPLRAGEPNTLFSCLHNSGESLSVPDGRLEIRLTDGAQNIIHEYTYTGDVTSDMMGVAEVFTPNRSYNVVHLDARLYQGVALVDEAYLIYDCREIDPATCLLDGDRKAVFMDFGDFRISKDALMLGIFVFVGLLILAVLGWILKRLRSRAVEPDVVAPVTTPPVTTPPSNPASSQVSNQQSMQSDIQPGEPQQ